MAFEPRVAQKIPATVFTGFLGAGKTSLIQHLLRSASSRRIALIINEFGDVGVDRELLIGCGDKSCTDDIIELANGCICCTVADDFVPAMEQILGRAEPVDHIVIETSGLALPKPLIKAFNWPAIRNRVTVDGVVAVVDAAAIRDGLFASDPAALDAQRRADDNLDHESPLEELFEEQLGSADLVVVNKGDLIEDHDWGTIETRIRQELRPGVRMVRAAHANLALDILLGLHAAAETDLASRRSHHDDGEDHEHDDFESFHLDLPPLARPDDFIERLRQMVVDHGVLRVKGFLEVENRPMRLAVQGVGSRLQHYFDRPWSAGAPRQGRLVIIGEKGLRRKDIALMLGATNHLAA